MSTITLTVDVPMTPERETLLDEMAQHKARCQAQNDAYGVAYYEAWIAQILGANA